MRRDDDGHAARAIEVGEQLRDLELRAEIERRGRLVEQQHVGGLGQRRGDHHALLLAAAERGEVAIFERGRARRAPAPRGRSRRSAGPSTSNTPEMRVAAHQHHLHHRVVEGELRLLRHDGHAAGERRGACSRPAAGPSRCTCPLVGRRVPDSIRSSVVLPEPFGPSTPTTAPAGDLERDARDHRPGRRRSAKPSVSGVQQHGVLRRPCGRAPDIRACPRTARRRR